MDTRHRVGSDAELAAVDEWQKQRLQLGALSGLVSSLAISSEQLRFEAMPSTLSQLSDIADAVYAPHRAHPTWASTEGPSTDVSLIVKGLRKRAAPNVEDVMRRAEARLKWIFNALELAGSLAHAGRRHAMSLDDSNTEIDAEGGQIFEVIAERVDAEQLARGEVVKYFADFKRAIALLEAPDALRTEAA